MAPACFNHSMTSYYKRPRLYTDQTLKEGQSISLTQDQVHHLKNVLRLKPEETVRIFNEKDGEWLGYAEILSKKTNTFRIDSQLVPHIKPPHPVSLYFAPIKKHRQDWLVEKAIELGVTDLHIIITQNTSVRSINEKRVITQIREAAEQSEQMHLAKLHAPISLQEFLQRYPEENTSQKACIYACLERCDQTTPLEAHLGTQAEPSEARHTAVMIGPEGGYTEEEKDMIINHPNFEPVSLGEHVLRCETAAIKALILAAHLTSQGKS